MYIWFFILTALFIIVSAGMILIILVQRPQGGGLAGAFGGAGGGGTDSVFGGRVGDALTMITVGAFVVYLLLAILLNKIPITGTPQAQTEQNIVGTADPNEPALDVTSPTSQDFTLTPLDGPPPGFENLQSPPPSTGTTPPPTTPPDSDTDPGSPGGGS